MNKLWKEKNIQKFYIAEKKNVKPKKVINK